MNHTYPHNSSGEKMLKKRLFIHIGTEKTGTTSIQSALRQNSQKLKEHDVFYPNMPLLAATHIGFVYSFLEEQQMSLLLRRGGFDNLQEKAKQNPHFILDILDKKIEESGCNTVIISSELLHSRITKEEQLMAIKTWAKERFNEITVICYLRKQTDLMVSSYSTMVKTGSNWYETLSQQFAHFIEGRHKTPHFYDYKGILDMWSNAFPHFIVKEFTPNKLLEGDVVKDFFSLIDSSINIKEFDNLQKENTSLDGKAMEFLSLLNIHIPSVINGRTNPLRKNMVDYFNAIPTTTKMQFTQDELMRIEQYFKEDNAYVQKKYFKGDSLFESKSATSMQNDHSRLNTIEAVEVFTKVWDQISTEMIKIEEENKKLEAQINAL